MIVRILGGGERTRMFRYAPEENRNPKLRCVLCGFIVEDIPVHCGAPMRWKLSRSFRKVQVLGCSVCEHTIAMPDHCGVPMVYSNSDYKDLPELTELDLKAMDEAYSVKLRKEERDDNVAS